AGGDPVARFVTELNAKATAVGAVATTIINPHGLPVGGQSTTATDMAYITLAASEYPRIASVWGLAADTISVDGPNARSFEITSSVDFIGDADIIGGKTGTISPSNYNLAVQVAMPNGNRLIYVGLASDSDQQRYTDARAVIDAVREGFYWPVVVPT